MKTPAAIAAMLACAALGAAGAGWILRSGEDHGGHHHGAHHARQRDNVPPSPARLALSTDLAGAAEVHWPLTMRNPLDDSPSARMAGRQLYLQMNCAGCHGYHGEGNMGPKLSDPYWIYGGTPAAIYRTLDQGRPKGMPAWGRLLPPESLWQLTSYVGSMGGGVPPDQAQAELQGDFRGGSTDNGDNNGAVRAGRGQAQHDEDSSQ